MRAATRKLPRSGKELILSTREFASDDTLRSWWCVWSTLGLLVAALAGTLVRLPFPATLAFSVLAGLLTVRLFVLFHDAHNNKNVMKAVDALRDIVEIEANNRDIPLSFYELDDETFLEMIAK